MNIYVKLISAAVVLVSLVWTYYASPATHRVQERQGGLHQTYLETKRRSGITTFPRMDTLLTSIVTQFMAAPPTASARGGFYACPLSIRIASASPEATIRYTLDGSIPTHRSPQYTEPIPIEQTTVLRMRAFQRSLLPSEIVTHTYLIDEDVRLPVVSLSTDPVNLWNPHSGLYTNPYKRGGNWERNAHIEYFEGGHTQPTLAFPVKFRIHGNWSRRLPKKSFRLRYPLAAVAGADAGNILTSGSPAPERNVILRVGGSNYRWRLYDELFQSLYADVGGLSSPHVPAMLFLNGRRWGIYNIRERIDADFLLRRFGDDSYDLIKSRTCWTKGFKYVYACYEEEAGDQKHWRQTIDFFRSANLADPANFEAAAALVDLDNVTDYWLYNIYAANIDWPVSNVYVFRRKQQHDARWRWISWDADQTFGVREGMIEDNTLGRVTTAAMPPDQPVDDFYADNWKGTLIVRKLLENAAYGSRFITRLCDVLNAYLLPQRVEARLDQIIDPVRYDLPKDLERWETPEADYWSQVQRIRDFARQRPAVLRRHVRERFGLGNEVAVRIVVQAPGTGSVQVNTIKPEHYPWTGQYFAGMEITLKAIPEEGYRFAGWSNPSWGTQPEVRVVLDKAVDIAAVFEQTRSESAEREVR